MTGQRLLLGTAWLAFPAIVLLREGTADLLADWSATIVIAGTIALALLLAGAWLARRPTGEDPEDPPLWAWAGRCGIHLLPLYVITMVGIDSLGSSGITSLRPPDLAGMQGGPAPLQPVVGVLSSSGGPPPSTRPATAREFTMLDLYYPLDHPGVDEVEVVGRWMAVEDMPKNATPPPGGLDGVVYRHFMICCAADAQPVPAGLRDARPDTTLPWRFPKDAWIRVRGRWIHAVGDDGLAIIEVLSIAPTTPPASPYLSPRWR
jgi:hypothetical protein